MMKKYPVSMESKKNKDDSLLVVYRQVPVLDVITSH